eukprot:633031-Prymnesium_polylepis.1
MLLACLLLACCLSPTHGYWAGTAHRSLRVCRPVVMRKIDDTKRAAEAEAVRLAEEAQLAAEAASDPEPGPCIACGDEGTYWDGMVTFACTRCGHEWGIEEAKSAQEEFITRDVNGAELANGDHVVLTKDLAKGSLKKGTKVKVRLGDFGDNHNLEATIPTMGTYALKSEFVKKAG